MNSIVALIVTGCTIITRIIHDFLPVLCDYLPHSLVPSNHEPHQLLIMLDGHETKQRVWEGCQRCERDAAGDGFGLLLAATGAEDRVYVDRGGIETHRLEIVFVGVEDSLRVVLVCETDERRQCFDVIDGRIRDWVDELEERLECFRGIVNVDDRELRGFSG